MVSHRIILVYSASGAGKSSLLRAGLGPRLADEGFDVLPPGRFTGGGDPQDDNPFVAALIGHLREAGVPGRRPVAPHTLAEYLATRPRRGGEGDPEPRALIIDQFEELFQLHPERWPERAGVFEQLADALEADPLLRVIVAMREEFLAQFELHVPAISTFSRARFHLERLRRDPAMRAVTGPLEGRTTRFAPGVAESLVDELLQERLEAGPDGTGQIVGEFVEPVQLQVVLRQLWLTLPPGVEVIEAGQIERLGGVDEALGSYYDESVKAAAEACGMDQPELRRLLAAALITPNELRGTAQRGAESTAGIPNAALTVLEDRHLVRAELRAGSRWYELSHDRLIQPILESNRRIGAAHADRVVKERLRTADDDRARAEALAARWKRWGIAAGAGLLVALCIALGVAVYFWQEATDSRNVAQSRVLARESLDERSVRPSASGRTAIDAFEREDTAEAAAAVREVGAAPLTAILRPSKDAPLQADSAGDDSSVAGVALSQDGARAAISFPNGPGLLWDLRQGGSPRTLWEAPDQGDVTSAGAVAFSPGGSRLVAVGPGGRLLLFDLQQDDLQPVDLGPGSGLGAATGESLLVGNDGRVGYVSEDLDIDTLASSIVVEVWDPAAGTQARRWKIPNDLLFPTVTLSSDLGRVSLDDDEGTIATFHLLPGGKVERLPDRVIPGESAAGVSQDGRWLVKIEPSGTPTIVDMDSDRIVARLGGSRAVEAAVSQDGRRAAGIRTTGSATLIPIWEVARPGAPARVLRAPPSVIGTPVLSADGSHVFVGGPGSAMVWSTDGGPGVPLPAAPGGGSMSRDGGRVLLAASSGGRVLDVDAALTAPALERMVDFTVDRRGMTMIRRRTDQGIDVVRTRGGVSSVIHSVPGPGRIPEGQREERSAVGAAAGVDAPTPAPADATFVSDDGTTLSVVKEKGTPVWRVDGAQARRVGVLPPLPATGGVVLGPEARLAATYDQSGTLQVFDVASGRAVIAPSSNLAFGDLEFSADGRWFATFDEDGAVAVYDLTETPSTRRTLTMEGTGSDLEFSPDGSSLAAATNEGVVVVWDLASGSESSFEGAEDEAGEIDWAPDGTSLAAWGANGAIRVFSLGDGRSTLRLRGHTAKVSEVAFSPDGARLLSGAEDGTTRVWDARSGRELTVLRGPRSVTLVHFDASGSRIATLDEEGDLRIRPCSWWCAEVEDLVPQVDARFPEEPVD